MEEGHIRYRYKNMIDVINARLGVKKRRKKCDFLVRVLEV